MYFLYLILKLNTVSLYGYSCHLEKKCNNTEISGGTILRIELKVLFLQGTKYTFCHKGDSMFHQIPGLPVNSVYIHKE